MSAISVRLPKELDKKLTEEAHRSGKRLSEVVREAVSEHIRRQERQTFLRGMIEEMHDWLGDPRARQDSRELAENVADDLDALVEGETRTDAITQWWR